MSAAVEIERFAKDVQSNEALRAEIKPLGTDQVAILRLANAKGYNFTMADVEALGASGELTDEQLAGVAGGLTILYTDGKTTLSGGSYAGVYKSGKNVFIW
ncbi:MAG: Nif11-like leader peptide family RiPP precursor [Acidobacteria bacterium]|nr:Nif11-like leader peptide family RiPP precursor [Acidobacteriota bacterium]